MDDEIIELMKKKIHKKKDQQEITKTIVRSNNLNKLVQISNFTTRIKLIKKKNLKENTSTRYVLF